MPEQALANWRGKSEQGRHVPGVRRADGAACTGAEAQDVQRAVPEETVAKSEPALRGMWKAFQAQTFEERYQILFG